MMFVPTLALLVAGLGLAFAPNVGGHAIAAAERLQDRDAHALEVLQGHRPEPSRSRPCTWAARTCSTAWSRPSARSAIGFLGLYRRRLPAVAGRVTAVPVRALKSAHSGVVGDYVAWLTVGAATLGGLFALTLR